ncbi:hypothetical protein RSAG8_09804, partial [Rhizoctonia solani AG-8 WAC10335]
MWSLSRRENWNLEFTTTSCNPTNPTRCFPKNVGSSITPYVRTQARRVPQFSSNWGRGVEVPGKNYSEEEGVINGTVIAPRKSFGFSVMRVRLHYLYERRI